MGLCNLSQSNEGQPANIYNLIYGGRNGENTNGRNGGEDSDIHSNIICSSSLLAASN